MQRRGADPRRITNLILELHLRDVTIYHTDLCVRRSLLCVCCVFTALLFAFFITSVVYSFSSHFKIFCAKHIISPRRMGRMGFPGQRFLLGWLRFLLISKVFLLLQLIYLHAAHAVVLEVIFIFLINYTASRLGFVSNAGNLGTNLFIPFVLCISDFCFNNPLNDSLSNHSGHVRGNFFVKIQILLFFVCACFSIPVFPLFRKICSHFIITIMRICTFSFM